MVSRRKFIRIMGVGGGVAALTAGGGYWAMTRGAMPDSAVAPWRAPGQGIDDPRIRAAAHALLAPNPHNMQPWLLRLEGDNALTLHVDLDRLLPETDPPGRQILIGHGTFLEIYRMAAAESGHRAEIELLPEGSFAPERLDGRPVARLRLVRDPVVIRDPLFAAVGTRRSNKETYDIARPVTDGELAALTGPGLHGARVMGSNDPALRPVLRDLMEAGLRREIETPRTFRESIDLMRLGPEEIARNPDGIELAGPMIWWGTRLGFVSREAIATPGTQSFQIGLDMARDQAQTAMGFAWVVSPDNSRASQIRAGMDYVRLNLQATVSGVALHPMSQLLQEYPEMADLQARLLDALAAEPPAHVQMLVRLGHAAAPGPTPRRPVAAIVRA
ncbi:Acg family FMN-binding oxidoreductase [Minwuia thermotolerans]|uniref:Twin-arginine translocation pathway signal protein n=1 Tax=Minwuia thermotolerans TaxID=2056226 RepID=A0A2M9FX97_9PROT|nr:twin-arginine translocation pathway signal protein [Minwuia thermotolerans]PJK28085.1 twin-arginine translocation pathway signal protein [Minwuia thermotolerans]